MNTCLLVDDSKIARLFARSLLEDLHFEVSEAVNGQDALEQCQDTLPDLVLLDWNMPVMDGLAFLLAARQLPGTDQVKIVFCTTRTELSNIATALTSGADEYLMKPFDREALESKLLQIGLLS